jgi:hypothetical protein
MVYGVYPYQVPRMSPWPSYVGTPSHMWGPAVRWFYCGATAAGAHMSALITGLRPDLHSYEVTCIQTIPKVLRTGRTVQQFVNSGIGYLSFCVFLLKAL